jgi:hypothetical protein
MALRYRLLFLVERDLINSKFSSAVLARAVIRCGIRPMFDGARFDFSALVKLESYNLAD